MFDLVRNILALLAAPFTLILVIVAVRQMWHGRLKLKANVTSSVFRPIPGTRKQVEEFIDAFRAYELQEKIKERVEIQPVAEKLPATIFSKYSAGPLFEMTTIWVVFIWNEGKAEIADLKFHFPIGGIYASDQSNSPESSPFDREITLGTLRSKGTIELTLWTNRYARPVSDEEIYLSHSAGSVPVRTPLLIFGAFDKAILGPRPRNIIAVAVMSCLVCFLMIALTVYLAFLLGRQAERRLAPATQPTSHPN